MGRDVHTALSAPCMPRDIDGSFAALLACLWGQGGADGPDVCTAAELSTIAEQFPVQPLQYLPKTLRLSFQEGMKLLQQAGFEVGADPADFFTPKSHRM